MMYEIISSLLKKADPELSHSLAIKFLKNNFLPLQLFTSKISKKLEINVLGKTFSNPIGLAAGFDKMQKFIILFLNLGLDLQKWEPSRHYHSQETQNQEYFDWLRTEQS